MDYYIGGSGLTGSPEDFFGIKIFTKEKWNFHG
jgi:hypothetical protein